jgi:chorismate synthase
MESLVPYRPLILHPMASNSIGSIFKVSSFGESHGRGVGVLMDGVPAGIIVDVDFINQALQRRRPGQSNITTQRNESDRFQILSGIFDNKTLGSPVCIWIPNEDPASGDYEELKDVYRPGHADYTYDTKYGFRDYRGGGRSSARVTAGWVAAGALAELALKQLIPNVSIVAWVQQIHSINADLTSFPADRSAVDINTVRCPDPKAASTMEAAILSAKEEGDSLGGVIRCNIKNAPAGLGEPVFDKLSARLAQAMMSVNAVKGFYIGENPSEMKGSDMNDNFISTDGNIATETNHSAGIQGGISNGMPIHFDVIFKPTSTIRKKQNTVDKYGNHIALSVEGRHDPCVLPRAVPIVEAMTAITLLDMVLLDRVSRINL